MYDIAHQERDEKQARGEIFKIKCVLYAMRINPAPASDRTLPQARVQSVETMEARPSEEIRFCL